MALCVDKVDVDLLVSGRDLVVVVPVWDCFSKGYWLERMSMREKLVIALLTLVAVILPSVYTGATELVNSASSQDNVGNVNNQVVFSIPVGDNGIHYEGADNPDMLIWGPPTFTVAPDGTFWIADTPDDYLLRFNSDGLLLDKISISDFVIGAGDLEVSSATI